MCFVEPLRQKRPGRSSILLLNLNKPVVRIWEQLIYEPVFNVAAMFKKPPECKFRGVYIEKRIKLLDQRSGTDSVPLFFNFSRMIWITNAAAGKTAAAIIPNRIAPCSVVMPQAVEKA